MAERRRARPMQTRHARRTRRDQAGQLEGQLRDADRRTCPTGARRPSARPASTRRRASRSTRGCRTCRRRRRDERRRRHAPAGVRGRGRGARGARGGADAAPSRCASSAPAAGRCGRCCSTSQLQIAARRRRYDAVAQERLFELFGPAASWGRRCTRCRGRARRSSCRRSPDVDAWSSCRCPARYDLEVAASRYLDALEPAARCRSSSCSAGPCSTRATRRLQATRIAWESEAELPAAGERVARDDGPRTSPAPLAAAGQRERSTGSPRSKARNALATWEETVDTLLGRRARDWTPVRAIADAVLYEGYLLWPYRRSALKNQRRWTFGGVYPRRTRGHRRRWRMRTECLVEARATSTCACASCRSSTARCRRRPVDGRAAASARDVGRGDRARVSAAGAARASRAPSSGRGLGGGRGSRGARSRDGRRGGRVGCARRTVEIANTTPCDVPRGRRSAHVLLARTSCCARAAGAFVSLTDPPDAPARGRGRRCRNEGPGRCSSATRRTRHRARLADHPRGPPADRAREPGRPVRRRRDRPAADAQHPRADRRGEGRDARGDPRAREILERTEALTREQLLRLRPELPGAAAMTRADWEELERAGAGRVAVGGVELRPRQPRARCARARAATCSTSRSRAGRRRRARSSRTSTASVQLAVVRRGRPGPRPRRAAPARPPLLLRARRGRAAGRAGRGPRCACSSPASATSSSATTASACALAGRLARRDAAGRRRGRRLRHPRHGPRLRAARRLGRGAAARRGAARRARRGRCT